MTDYNLEMKENFKNLTLAEDLFEILTKRLLEVLQYIIAEKKKKRKRSADAGFDIELEKVLSQVNFLIKNLREIECSMSNLVLEGENEIEKCLDPPFPYLT